MNEDDYKTFIEGSFYFHWTHPTNLETHLIRVHQIQPNGGVHIFTLSWNLITGCVFLGDAKRFSFKEPGRKIWREDIRYGFVSIIPGIDFMKLIWQAIENKKESI